MNNKRILLGAAITLASLQVAAIPFAPTDARAMAMGGTGVSSAEVASTVQFNPALLAHTRADDHFGLKIPQFMMTIADDDGFIDEVEDFDEESENAPAGSGLTNVDLLDQTLTDATSASGLEKLAQALEDLKNAASGPQYDAAETKLGESVDYLDGIIFTRDANTPALVLHSNAVADDLEDLNEKSLRLNLGVNIALAVPSKNYSMALSAGSSAVISGQVLVNDSDTDILRNYSAATSAFLSKVDALQAALAAADNLAPSDPEVAAIEAAEDEVNAFNYGGGQAGTGSDEGDTAIFTKGKLVADEAALKSKLQMVGVGITDIGLTVSRVFNIKGNNIAFGITPKLQKVTVFDYTQDLDGEECFIDTEDTDNDLNTTEEICRDVEFDSDAVTDSTEEYTSFNLDLGAAYKFGAEQQFQAGIVIKNLIPHEYESAPYVDTNGVLGTIVETNPMVRAGISHHTDWTKVAFDLDITENDPVAFEEATQYASLGAELNVWRTVQLRAGYRANLASSGQDVVTAGIGFSPFAVHLDIGVMANATDPEKEAGIALEFGVEF
jgi:hypothetical protein